MLKIQSFLLQRVLKINSEIVDRKVKFCSETLKIPSNHFLKLVDTQSYFKMLHFYYCTKSYSFELVDIYLCVIFIHFILLMSCLL